MNKNWKLIGLAAVMAALLLVLIKCGHGACESGQSTTIGDVMVIGGC